MRRTGVLCMIVFYGSFAHGQSLATRKTPAEHAELKPSEITQTGDTVHVAVTSARPLVTALDLLRNKYGWSVNYEDPQFVGKADLAESNDARYVNSASGARPHIPNGGLFTMDFPVGGAVGPDEQKTLKALVEAYNHSANPGRYELRQQDQHFDVVGIAAHDGSGQIKGQTPPLDAIVTLAAKESSTIEAVTSICDQVSKLTSLSVSVGVYPQNLFSRPVKIATAEKLEAREALYKIFARALADKEQNISWRLLYDPDSQSYVVNFHLRK